MTVTNELLHHRRRFLQGAMVIYGGLALLFTYVWTVTGESFLLVFVSVFLSGAWVLRWLWYKNCEELTIRWLRD